MQKTVFLFLVAVLLLGCTANDAPESSKPTASASLKAASSTALWSGWPWKPLERPLTSNDFDASDATGAKIYALAAPEARITRAHFSVIKPSSWLSAYPVGEQYKTGQSVGNAPNDQDENIDYVMVYPVELRPPIAAGVPATADASYFSVVSAAQPGSDPSPLHGASVSIDAIADDGFRALAAQGPKAALLSLKKASGDWNLAGFPSDLQSPSGTLIQERSFSVSGFSAYEIVMNRTRYVEANVLVIGGPDSPGYFIQLFYGNGNSYTFTQVKTDFDKMVQSIQLQN